MQETLDLGTAASGHGSAGSAGFVLRPYQADALTAVTNEIRKGKLRTLVALPTGTGKTVVFAHLPQRLELGTSRMLVLAHREELLDQAARKLQAVNPGMTVAVEQASRHAYDAQVVVASVATLRGKRLDQLDPGQFGAIVIDEAHHAIANSYTQVLAHFDCDTTEAAMPVIGFTATPKRGDGVGLSAVFDSIAYDAPMLGMIEDGFLSRVTGIRLDTKTDLSEVSVRMGEFVTSQLAQAVDTAERNEVVVSGFLEHASDRQKTLVFAVDVQHAIHLAESFERAGLSTAAIYGQMDKDKRRQVLAAFGRGDIDLLTNCMVLTEGFDEPAVDCILMARPTKSALLYTQMIGRGTRMAPDKSDVLVIDCTDNSAKHDLVSVSTLFGLPKRLNLGKKDAMEVAEQLELEGMKHPWLDLDKLRTLDDLNVAATKIEFFASAVPPELQSWTKLQWVRQPSGAYKLPLPDREFILVETTRLDKFRVTMTYNPERESKERVPLKRWCCGELDTLREAIRAGDKAVKDHRGDSTRLLDTRAKWRDADATDKQLALLKRMHIEHPPGITKGQAATILTLAFNNRSKRGR